MDLGEIGSVPEDLKIESGVVQRPTASQNRDTRLTAKIGARVISCVEPGAALKNQFLQTSLFPGSIKQKMVQEDVEAGHKEVQDRQTIL